jgi:TetR/AcrR family fatty acid metabolism transcriptional regulator
MLPAQTRGVKPDRSFRLTLTAAAHRMNRGSAFMRDPDKPRQIVDAAIRVFARKGYWSSRVSDIAREAGIAAGTIYLYFKTKEDILITVFREKMAEFVSALWRAIAEEPDPVAKVRRLVSMHFEILERHPEMAEVVQVELRQGQKFFRGPATHEIAAYFALIASVLEEGVAAGQFRRDLPVKLATKMLFGAMDQMATSWVLGKRGYRLADTAPAVADLFLQGIAAIT